MPGPPQPVLAPLLVAQTLFGAPGVVQLVLAPPVALTDCATRREQEVDPVVSPFVCELRLQDRVLEAAPRDHRAADALTGRFRAAVRARPDPGEPRHAPTRDLTGRAGAHAVEVERAALGRRQGGIRDRERRGGRKHAAQVDDRVEQGGDGDAGDPDPLARVAARVYADVAEAAG
ncbi:MULTISPECIES: hypothetical protein [unclassified Microbacterium]|uniref:hypothetical protein n=1 Tax=unclassified Microbacterium TaxID=2609290 RepID=UPI003015C2D6